MMLREGTRREAGAISGHLLRGPQMDANQTDCPGRFKCHGPASWCNECGDVDLVCDDPKCEVHLRSFELVCMEAAAAKKMDEAHAAYKAATKEWADISAKVIRFQTGNVFMVARSQPERIR